MTGREPSTARDGTERVSSSIRTLPFRGDDAQLLVALQANHTGASFSFHERYASHVRAVLVRTMGFDQELPDLINEVFYQALRSIGTVADGSRLKAWITKIAVHVARGCLRKRKRERWLRFYAQPAEIPVHGHPGRPDDSLETMREVYRVLDAMPVDQRLAFSLRYIEGMQLAELADVFDVSLATLKRRLARCERRFKVLARRYPMLSERLSDSPKWSRR